MFLRDNSRGGAASPAGKLRVSDGRIQVLTPNSKGPWGQGGEVIELREWKSRFRREDPVITPKAMSNLFGFGGSGGASGPSRESLTPNKIVFTHEPVTAGLKCRFLQKYTSELDRDAHKKQLRFSVTVSEKLLATAVDELQEAQEGLEQVDHQQHQQRH
jgi:hypothetical protein